MKIVLVSDSHGDDETLNKIHNMFTDADLYIHCGDSESDPFSIAPFVSVRGNCDYFGDFQESLLIPSPQGSIFVTHKPNVSRLFLKEKGIRIVFHGHTHVRRDETIEGIRYINPGSTRLPRDGSEGSFAIVTITEKEFSVRFLSLSFVLPK